MFYLGGACVCSFVVVFVCLFVCFLVRKKKSSFESDSWAVSEANGSHSPEVSSTGGLRVLVHYCNTRRNRFRIGNTFYAMSPSGKQQLHYPWGEARITTF